MAYNGARVRQLVDALKRSELERRIDEELAEVVRDLSQREAEVERLRQDSATKDDLILHLRQEIAELRKDKDTDRDRLRVAEEAIADLRKTVAERDATILRANTKRRTARRAIAIVIFVVASVVQSPPVERWWDKVSREWSVNVPEVTSANSERRGIPTRRTDRSPRRSVPPAKSH